MNKIKTFLLQMNGFLDNFVYGNKMTISITVANEFCSNKLIKSLFVIRLGDKRAFSLMEGTMFL